MLFVTKKGYKENIELKVFNTKIKTVSDVKSYEQHFHYIIGKMSKLLDVLYNTKHLLELYISFPVHLYFFLVWSCGGRLLKQEYI